MQATGEPAEPIATGTLARAKQAFGDLFRWKQRVETTNGMYFMTATHCQCLRAWTLAQQACLQQYHTRLEYS